MKKSIYILSLIILNLVCYSQPGNLENINSLRVNSDNNDNINGIIRENAKIRLSPSPLDEIIHTFTKNDTVLLIDFQGGYWGIKHKEQIGYVSELFVIETEEIKEFKQEKIKDQKFEKQILLEITSLDNMIVELRKSVEDTIRQIEKKKYSLQQQIIKSRLNNFENLSVENQWNLLMKIGGCLTGAQYCSNGKCGGAGCVMSNSKYWNYFLKQPETKIVDFLILKIANTEDTEVHTCPFYSAKEGEVAIYALQFIYKTNWDDLSTDYKKYKEVEKTGVETSYQSFIWSIIGNENELKKMQQNWERMK